MITARALGVYIYLKSTGAQISAEGLASTFPEGREAMATCLKELREAGLLETKKVHINGRIMTVSQLVDTDYWAPETRLLSQQTQLNSKLNLIANSFISKPNSERSSREDTLEYYETKEEMLEAKRKHEARKHEEKLESHEARRQDRMLKRERKNAKLWSPTDSSFEFAEQMHNIFHIAPWAVTRSRFRYALDNKRKEYGTDGEIELVMMELYFSKIKHDTKLNDPEKVWKLFIVQFHTLLEEAKRVMVTPEEVKATNEKYAHTADWMDNV